MVKSTKISLELFCKIFAIMTIQCDCSYLMLVKIDQLYHVLLFVLLFYFILQTLVYLINGGTLPNYYTYFTIVCFLNLK